MPEKLEFKVSSGLKDIIGRDLITDDFIAVFELVKNSYDANAKNVFIEFKEDTIIISDDGDGMSIEDIKNKWLFVAYSSKKQDDQEDDFRDKIQKRRHYAGAKGIGRFSADRLGDDLVLTTKKLDSKNIQQISVNWNKFNNQKEKFESVKVDYLPLEDYSIPFPKNSKKGTILEIQGIKGWDRSKKTSLKHSLEKLINPFSESTDFNIEIFSKDELTNDSKEQIGRNKVNGPIKNAILDILKIKTTQINVQVTKDHIKSKLIDRGTLIYQIEEQNKKLNLIDDLKIDLYYLNTSAKNNFTRNMGIQPVKFGSVFLFKNGFRVQPYGDTDDDSWGLDYRYQQGYNRRLGTRNLFGRVEISTNNTTEFKEVSSRDGGMVETQGYNQLMEAFMNKGLLRLERYVVGVLWGEAFKRKNYFGQDEIAENYRKELLKKDQESDNLSIAKSNLGSKIDFIQLIKSLSTDDDIKIIEFNKDLVNLVNEQLDEVQTKFIADLEKIAEKIDNPDLDKIINLTEERYNQILREKEEAQRRAEEEEKRRIAAEEKAKKEEEARIKAEERARAEVERRRAAELEALRKENERLRAVEERRKEEERRKKEEDARKDAEQNLEHEKDKSAYLTATRKTLSEDAEELIHSIKVSVIGIDEGLEKILRRLRTDKSFDKSLYEEIGKIKFITDKVMKLSKLITKSNFKADQEVRKVKISQFIREYIDTYSYAYTDKIKISVSGNSDFISRISVLDFSIVLDNLISNSHKAQAKQIDLEIKDSKKGLDVLIHDDGKGVPNEFLKNSNAIFDLGVKSKIEGSGIGLHTVKKKMKENLRGDIEFLGNGIKYKGATFKLSFN
ncbi:sensor histidine kinase [Marinoscillum furvescens]|uniref:Signal transduction histidine kinase n=1 Tax=Marinoscillum furvescens DSM 4134 TaxID=1122208 RepID=A0A3D9KWP1_MARFU|nr:sensor histidine kinase [Marinoscillum furvescens]RED91643.1 signal transduction histidine kinase [Marinoscillum furvescens DSM 4134]